MNKNEALKTIEDLKDVIQRGEILILNYKSFFSIGAFLLVIVALKLVSEPIAAAVGTDPNSIFKTGKAVIASIFAIIGLTYFRKEILVSTGRLKSAYQLGATLGGSIILVGLALSKIGYAELILPMTMCLLGNLIAVYGVFSSQLVKYTGWSLILAGTLSLFAQQHTSVDLLIWQLVYIASSMLVVGFISRSEKLKFER
jgi:hypothetical protein